MLTDLIVVRDTRAPEADVYVLVENGLAELRRPGDVRSLKVVIAADGGRSALDDALRAAGLGRYDASAGVAWLSIEALGARAVRARGGCTETDFRTMIDFAGQHGWVADTDVRAHVESSLPDSGDPAAPEH
ncbi:hypothetical protein ABZ725_37545 [Streptomyces sp. NPDC006872]|uniref:hypothetical protein n=1 Tax=Streptomyces sp. NPDC006872 TaxID=3155720 RepID=UPI0033DDC3B6